MDSCPHCHRPYAPALQVNGPMRRRVVDLIASRPDGIGINEIAALVYADRPNDEPNWAANSLKTCVWWANPATTSHDGRRGLVPPVVYRLEKLPAPDKPVDGWHAMWAAPFGYPEML